MTKFVWDPVSSMYSPRVYSVRAQLDSGSSLRYHAYRAEVSQWMRDTNCGQWIGTYLIDFDTDADVAMFMLRWS